MQDSSSPSEAPQSFRDTILQKRRLKGCILLVIISWLLGQVLGCNPVFTEQRNTLVTHSQRTEENQRHQKQRDSDRKLLNPMVITSLCLSSFLLQEEGVETTKHGHTGHGPHQHLHRERHDLCHLVREGGSKHCCQQPHRHLDMLSAR